VLDALVIDVALDKFCQRYLVRLGVVDEEPTATVYLELRREVLGFVLGAERDLLGLKTCRAHTHEDFVLQLVKRGVEALRAQLGQVRR
jgi:hypothetical protein